MRSTTIKIPALAIMALVIVSSACAPVLQGPGSQSFKDETMAQIKYISTEDQREKLELMKSDEEINMFLEEFWAELDPDPNTSENEFKQVYLVRYTYARENFSEFNRNGALSDRGRIFIIYGPPDEIRQMPYYAGDSEMEYREGIVPREKRAAHYIKSQIIWTYHRSADGTIITSSTQTMDDGALKFIFVDYHGTGGYELAFSNKEGEVLNAKLYHY